jgi:hypothetical protein
VRTYLKPAFAVPYGITLVIASLLIAFFGWAGFWLALAIFALVKVTRWGVPLIKLSYARAPDQPADDASAASESQVRSRADA